MSYLTFEKLLGKYVFKNVHSEFISVLLGSEKNFYCTLLFIQLYTVDMFYFKLGFVDSYYTSFLNKHRYKSLILCDLFILPANNYYVDGPTRCQCIVAGNFAERLRSIANVIQRNVFRLVKESDKFVSVWRTHRRRTSAAALHGRSKFLGNYLLVSLCLSL